MSNFVLSGESSMDLGNSLAKERQIHYLPFAFYFGEQEYRDDMFASLTPKDFYERMRGPEITHTSACNAEDYMVYFRELLKEGKDILHVTLSGGLSSTFQNALLAAETLKEEYPNQNILVVNSIGAASGLGVLMLKLADYRDAGHTVSEAYNYAEEVKYQVNHLFFSTDLTFYIRGGRISKAAGTFAQALSICPFCDMDDMGFLVVREKIRTKKKAVSHMLEKMEELAEGGTSYGDYCLIGHSMMDEDVAFLKEKIEEKFPALKGKVVVSPLGPTIGAHTGPGTIALFFMGEGRKPSEKSIAAKA